MSRKQLTQYEITHMENLTVRDEYWSDDYGFEYDYEMEVEDDDTD